MITPLLQSALDPIVQRRRAVRRLGATAAFLGGLVLAALLAQWFGVHPAQFALCAFVALFPAAWIITRWADCWEPDYREVARRIEGEFPDLHELLLTAVEQRPDPANGELNVLQLRVIADAVEQSRRQDWVKTVSVGSFAFAIAMLLLNAGALLWVLDRSFAKAQPAAHRAITATEDMTISPGDTTLERGSGLVVLATFNRDVPSEATLIIQPQNQPTQRIALVKNLDDPVFGGGLPEVDADFSYRIEYAGKATRDFAVKVFEHPRLDRADATMHFPEYTKLPEKQLPDTHRVSAVEGTKLDVAFQLNKPVKSATLVAKDGTRVPLTVQANKPVAELRDFPLRTNQTFELKLEDADGRANKVPAQFIVEARPNRRPELKFQTPKGDVRASPIEEVAFRGQAWDDFGLARYGLTVNVAGRGEQDIELGRDSATDERRDFTHLLKLEDLGVQPDELISWFLWADDTGPDGQTRRTATDMFFAEVRPFEEIYRPGDSSESQQQQQSGAGNQAQQQAAAQKQIIIATWNLKRAEEAAPNSPSEKYLKDEPVIRDAQAAALAAAGALAGQAGDAKAKALVENVTREMQSALDQLVKAEQTPAPLPDALKADQAAYNALLKLAAHEFRVTRSRSQNQNSRQAQQRNQQQLDELEVKDEKKRYETKSEAAPQQNEQQREQLAILNRLKELAQRQNDINERLKELQTALQAAQSEKEKEEVRRQLKRLREEEQQVLADVDEARQKMEQSPQQAQFADERRKLDETRSEAQKAAESMQQGETSKALASGTRAQRDLQQMRDDFRKKTSGQFTDEMREMRTDARDLAEKQQELAENLKEEPPKPERRTLGGKGEREQLAEKFTKQQGDLSKLTENMKRVSEQAEAAEPLLAKELYDTLRKTAQASTGETLEKTQLLTQRGYTEQARKFEEKARQEIDDIKTGVERAAESVLGDEAQALRHARAELDKLSEQLNREVAQARPDLADAAQRGKAGQPQRGEGQQKEGQPQGERGEQPGQQSGERGHSAQNSEQQRNGEQAGDSESGQQPGQQNGRAQQPGQTAQGEPQNGEGGGQQPGGQNPSANQNRSTNGERAGTRNADTARTQQPRDGQRNGDNRRGGLDGGANGNEQAGPLTGGNFSEWADRLRNVEEMVDDPALRTETARIREVAKGVRAEFKRHSVEPNWEMVNTKIRAPLAELRNRLTEELARRESKENLVPIDRDPVPAKFAERVRRYYEELGRSK